MLASPYLQRRAAQTLRTSPTKDQAKSPDGFFSRIHDGLMLATCRADINKDDQDPNRQNPTRAQMIQVAKKLIRAALYIAGGSIGKRLRLGEKRHTSQLLAISNEVSHPTAATMRSGSDDRLPPLFADHEMDPAVGEYSQSSVQSILVFRPDHIGDMLLSTPMLRALRLGFPSAHISVLSGSCSREILRNNPDVDEIIYCDLPGIAQVGGPTGDLSSRP